MCLFAFGAPCAACFIRITFLCRTHELRQPSTPLPTIKSLINKATTWRGCRKRREVKQLFLA
ncbi:hypothetical protein HMPREF3208_00267 [Gardnerella vaginalis]|uniref:Uncharacterized protein n=1 Tax=Gardnerella vaginalis TaxID=2702 RepID=A0A133P1V1_GARVA|nr:hypothetical protein HMPREF3208_00267 [Gardnerella vaginalis]